MPPPPAALMTVDTVVTVIVVVEVANDVESDRTVTVEVCRSVCVTDSV
jgi:hypothetical protein